MLNWWYAHNLFGLWLTPMLLALTYYMVPRITNTPLYSYTLSLICFWGMAFFYTGVGDHHILQSPTPAWLKTIAEVSSWMLLVPVFAFTINILGTMKGNWDKFFTNLPLRFTMTAFFFYFLVNIQGAFEAIQPFNKLHALHELRRRARAPRAARRLHDPRHGRDRLHRRPGLPTPL